MAASTLEKKMVLRGGSIVALNRITIDFQFFYSAYWKETACFHNIHVPIIRYTLNIYQGTLSCKSPAQNINI